MKRVNSAYLASLVLAAALAAPASEPPQPAPKDETSATQSAPEAWDTERLEKLLARLADEQFTTREAATTELGSAPAWLLPNVCAAAARSEDPEARTRVLRAARSIFLNQVAAQLPEAKMSHGFLGIRWYVCPDPPGILIQEVVADTVAAQGGLQAGDVLIQVNDREFGPGLTHESAMDVWRAMLPGDTMVLKLRRAEAAEPIEVKVVAGEAPPEYRRPDSDPEKAEFLWARYLAGRLKVPDELLARPSGVAGGAGEGPSRSRTPAPQPLQSWPRELEAHD